jgi:hypothetical protein
MVQCIVETAVSSAFGPWSLHVRLLLKLPVNSYIGRLRSNTSARRVWFLTSRCTKILEPLVVSSTPIDNGLLAICMGDLIFTRHPGLWISTRCKSSRTRCRRENSSNFFADVHSKNSLCKPFRATDFCLRRYRLIPQLLLPVNNPR